MRSILFLAHFFPPRGGAGVQRALKFVKYLPESGFRPLVLTGAADRASRWSPNDRSMLTEIRNDVPVFRLPKKDASRSALVALGSDIIRAHRPQLIFVTMSPFGDAPIAAALAQRHQLPWVADLRDPWALDEIQEYRTRWHRRRERGRMARCLRTASAIILNTPEAAARFRRAFPALAAKASFSLTNGYDASDFAAPVAASAREHFTIVHSGFLHAGDGLRRRRRRFVNRLLGRTEPGVDVLSRSHFYLLQALAVWLERKPEIRRQVRVRLLGALTPEDEQLVSQSDARSLVECTGYRPHPESIAEIRAADLLFLPMHTMPPGKRAGIVPGKTYEYMATGRPILAAVPEGDAKDFLREAGTASFCAPNAPAGMQRILERQFAAWRNGNARVTGNREFIAQFERRRLTKRLADILSEHCAANEPVAVRPPLQYA